MHGLLGLRWNIEMCEILSIEITIPLNTQLLSLWTMCVEHQCNIWSRVSTQSVRTIITISTIVTTNTHKTSFLQTQIWMFLSYSLELRWHCRQMKQHDADFEALLWLWVGWAPEV